MLKTGGFRKALRVGLIKKSYRNGKTNFIFNYAY